MIQRPKMAKVLPVSEYGKAKIEHIQVTKLAARLSALRASFSGERYGYTAPGKYATLVMDGRIWMSDTDMEWITNMAFLRNATGDVLVFGLGIGFILRALLPVKTVRSIKVVEHNPDVIGLMDPIIAKWKGGNKVTVVRGDAYVWETAQVFDTIYFDIWPDVNPDNWAQMKKLKRRYRSNLSKHEDSWMGCWREDDCKRFDKKCRDEERLMYGSMGGKM